jgi:hypothetical protein
MPKREPWLGEIPKVDKGLGKAGPFQADDRITSTESGRHIIPEHDKAIDKAMEQLYGGMVGSRCDPVEEWPGDHDETYGMPKSVREGIDPSRTYGEADRDDEKTFITDKPGDLKRRIGVSDLSGATDRIAEDDDFAERNEHDDDQGFITHH